MLIHVETTEAITGAAFEVYNNLGYGFLEQVYQRALQVELMFRGFSAILEHPIKVNYKNVLNGEYFADIIVNYHVLMR
jgi:GxxExxY protein